ncbi:hypothetical protein PG984_009786 [Apiospora sp. TS-2023a]
MPPKRKRTAPPPPSPPPEPRASSSPGPAASEDQDEEDSGGHDAEHPLPTLFNTTFALYRASPLYLGPERLNKARLKTLSKRLRDTLVGDVVRGVQVGLTSSSSEDATLGRAGVLESVDWRWVPLRKLLPRRAKVSREAAKRRRRQQREGSAELGSREEDSDEDRNSESEEDQDRNSDARALSVELRYENNTFAACLLPRLYKNSDGTDDEDNTAAAAQWISTDNATDRAADRKQFAHLPLLLLRMPAPLRTVLNDFLSRTFDVRIRPLRLGTRSVVSSWAAWHTNSGISGGDDDGRHRGLLKDVVLSLGFHVLDESLASEAQKMEQGDPSEAVVDTKKNGDTNNNDSHPKTLGLKAIDIIMPAEEVRRFIRAGQQVVRDRDEEASESNKRKGKRKAGEQSSDTGGAGKLMMSPSRRRKLAGGRDDEGWTWRSAEGDQDQATIPTSLLKEPFIEALGMYLDRHLALNMFHPGVRILRIACEGFVLSEGRIKVFRPPLEDGSRSAWRLLDGLVERARGRDWGSVPVIPGL